MKKNILLFILVILPFTLSGCSGKGGGATATVTVTPVTISTTALPDGTLNTAYNVTLVATGGTTPYIWTITSGSLPSGLAVDPNTGVISGTPGTGEIATFTVKVTDSSQPAKTATQNLSVTIDIPLTARQAAARNTVASNAYCSPATLGDFYWEIGDANGTLVFGNVGTTYSSSTPMDIASASKFIFGAYVVENFKTDISSANAQAMRMGSGYVSLDYTSCVGAANVDACFHATHFLKSNSDFTPADAGDFYYNGGHFQAYADQVLNLGPLDSVGLAAEMKNKLGQELNIAYGSPQLAAGVNMSAADYAQFLRKIISGGLAIKDHLGEDPVCTYNVNGNCPTAVYSPASPYQWHYSWGHWIEDDPSNGDDGAFSSPGAFGFYPWIDSSNSITGYWPARLAASIYLTALLSKPINNR